EAYRRKYLSETGRATYQAVTWSESCRVVKKASQEGREEAESRALGRRPWKLLGTWSDSKESSGVEGSAWYERRCSELGRPSPARKVASFVTRHSISPEGEVSGLQEGSPRGS